MHKTECPCALTSINIYKQTCNSEPIHNPMTCYEILKYEHV